MQSTLKRMYCRPLPDGGARIMLAALAALQLWGCASAPSSPGESANEALQAPMRYLSGFVEKLTKPELSRLKELVEGRKFDEAAAYYADNKAELDASQKEVKALLRRVAQGINARFEPQAARHAAFLSQADAGDGPSVVWSTLRSARISAQRLLHEYDAIALMRDPAYRSTAVGALKNAYARFTGEFSRAQSRAFSQWVAVSDKSFFDAYPIDVERGSLLKEAYPRLRHSLAAASREKLRSFIHLYGKYLSQEAQGDVQALATAALIRETYPNGNPTVSELGSLFVKYGGELGNPGALPFRVSLLVLNGKENEAWLKLKSDLPLQPRLLQAEALRSNAAGSDYLYLVHVLRGEPRRRQIGAKTVSSRYVSSKTMAPNIDYQRAQRNYANAQQTLQYVKMKQQEIEMQARQNAASGMSGLMGALNSTIAVGSIGLVASAESDVAEARAKLGETPTMVEKNLYGSYSYRDTAVEITWPRIIVLHGVDARNGLYARKVFNASAKRTFHIVSGLNSTDPERDKILHAPSVLDEDQLEATLRTAGPSLEVSMSGVLTRIAKLPASRTARAMDEVEDRLQADTEAMSRMLAGK